MTTEAYLGQLINVDHRIMDKLEEASHWYDIALSYGSREIKEDMVQTSHKPDKMAEAVARALDCKREAEQIAQTLTQKKYVIIKQIDGLENENHYNIIKARYLKGISLNEFAKENNYSRRHVQRIMNSALDEFEDKYGIIYGSRR